MRQIRLGQRELQVSRIAFGTWAYGGDWGAADVDDAKASIHRALALGINLFDTAQGYGFGAAERLLGEAVRERARREDVVIATKGGLRMEGDRLLRDASSRWLHEGVEASLRSLGTEYIDLYQVHWPDPRTPPEETAAALEDLVRQGKVRHVGVSNYDVQQMAALGRAGRVETLQPPYHLFGREIEDQILPYCAEHDVGVLVHGSLAHGLLSGRMRPSVTFDPDDWRSKSPDFTGETFQRNPAVVERLRGRRRPAGRQPAAAGGRLDAGQPGGARRDRRRAPAVPARRHRAGAGVQLSEPDLKEMDAIVADAVPVWGPHPESM
jgi:aryl-alcohol dehydrogenase-like predicted oxidoreductase